MFATCRRLIHFLAWWSRNWRKLLILKWNVHFKQVCIISNHANIPRKVPGRMWFHHGWNLTILLTSSLSSRLGKRQDLTSLAFWNIIFTSKLFWFEMLRKFLLKLTNKWVWKQNNLPLKCSAVITTSVNPKIFVQ